MKRNLIVAFRQPRSPPVDCVGTSWGIRGDVAPPRFRFEFSVSLSAILSTTNADKIEIDDTQHVTQTATS